MRSGVRVVLLSSTVTIAGATALSVVRSLPTDGAVALGIPHMQLAASYTPTVELAAAYTPTIELEGKAG